MRDSPYFQAWHVFDLGFAKSIPRTAASHDLAQ